MLYKYKQTYWVLDQMACEHTQWKPVFTCQHKIDTVSAIIHSTLSCPLPTCIIEHYIRQHCVMPSCSKIPVTTKMQIATAHHINHMAHCEQDKNCKWWNVSYTESAPEMKESEQFPLWILWPGMPASLLSECDGDHDLHMSDHHVQQPKQHKYEVQLI